MYDLLYSTGYSCGCVSEYIIHIAQRKEKNAFKNQLRRTNNNFTSTAMIR